jgi:serine/threonine protein kinase
VTPFTQLTVKLDKHPGAEPLPGYRLIEPLGKGGFGEVWKCEAPGGLHKAIKFIPGGGEECRRELSAFERIKAIRHPYLLTLERVELTGFELLMVMELADCQFFDRMQQCQKLGLPGIPREELLGYLREVAEALDTISTRHGLQHLDVKPQNLFLVAGHAKVGDYGLVRSMERVAETSGHRGFTPRYTAPEVLQGGLDARSDQYSLALVYAELLTGTFPYSGVTGPQLILQHVTGAPNLVALPESDRGAVARALSKEPAARFPSCLAFVRAIPWVSEDRPSGQFRALPPPGADTPLPPKLAVEATPPPATPPPTRTDQLVADAVEHAAETGSPDQTMLARAPSRRGGPGPVRRARPEEPPVPKDQFSHLRPVMTVQHLIDKVATPAPKSEVSPLAFVTAVVQAASECAAPEPEITDTARMRRFLCTLPLSMIPLKLAVIAERFGLVVQRPDQDRVVLVRELPPPDPKSKHDRPEPPSRPEVTVRLPVHPACQINATGRVIGSEVTESGLKAAEELPNILDDVRMALQNQDERRRHPRYPTAFPVRVFPLYSDGDVGAPIIGRCEDVSMGGVRLTMTTPVRTERMFVEFQEVGPVAGLAVYAKHLRTLASPTGQGSVLVCRFRIATNPKPQS